MVATSGQRDKSQLSLVEYCNLGGRCDNLVPTMRMTKKSQLDVTVSASSSSSTKCIPAGQRDSIP